MATFKARLALAEDGGTEIGVEISLGEERIRVTANGDIIGDWSFEEVEIFNFGDGLHVFVEGEEVILSSEEQGFVAAMLEPAVTGPPPGDPTRESRVVRPGPEGIIDESRAGLVDGERNRRRGAHEERP